MKKENPLDKIERMAENAKEKAAALRIIAEARNYPKAMQEIYIRGFLSGAEFQIDRCREQMIFTQWLLKELERKLNEGEIK